MDKKESKLMLIDCIPDAVNALNELKDISIAYNASFEGEGTFVRLDKKRFNKMADLLIFMLLKLGLSVDIESE